VGDLGIWRTVGEQDPLFGLSGTFSKGF